ncbi:hypothetical protein NQ318_012196 [Aromia moschata]|uniref:Uncharacterized protein n=1 Tax=Aromia moschata TaxID=1265417 RepID=A0AAV8YYZ1_9CUCU|nr:hypothetical protein NQ318_012196 [Aromia moschata]
MRKVCARVVPKLLTLEQKESRMDICADILNNMDTDPGLLDTVTLKGTIFESVEAVKAKAKEVLNQLTEADFQHCFQQWKSCIERYRDRQGEYIEDEEVANFVKLAYLWKTEVIHVLVRCAQLKKNSVVQSVRENPRTSTRRRAQLNVSRTSLRRILHKDLGLFAYKLQLTQEIFSYILAIPIAILQRYRKSF